MLLRLAIRNLVRKRKRLFITVGAMGFAAALIIFYGSMMKGFTGSMIKSVVENEGGHIQVHAPGFREDPDLYSTVSRPAAILEAADKAGYKATTRLYGFGLVASGDASAGAELWGLDPEREKNTTRLAELVEKGSWLSSDDPYGVLVGKRLAIRLNLQPGSELVLLGQAADGSMANEIFRVRGVLGTVAARADSAGVMVLDSTFREIYMPPAGVHEVVIRLNELNPDLTAAKKIIQASSPGQEVLSWKELMPVIENALKGQDVGLILMMFIAYLAVGMVVFNAMLMNVFERISEFGVMKAVGVTPLQVFTMIGIEALLEGMLASLLGIILGWPAANWLTQTGMDLRKFTSDVSFGGISFEPIIYGTLEAEVFTTPIIFLFVLSIVAVIYPASKAALIRPVQAIYHR